MPGASRARAVPRPSEPATASRSPTARAPARAARLFEELLLPRLANEALGAAPRRRRPRRGRRAPRLHHRHLRRRARSSSRAATSARLAVHGTLNDLAMCGARPARALLRARARGRASPSRRSSASSRRSRAAARAAGVPVVTGDTKVVERGKGDGLFVNTAGVGLVPPGRDAAPRRACARRRRRSSPARRVPRRRGALGARGARVRVGNRERQRVARAPRRGAARRPRPELRCLRDPTRGGLGAALHEIARGRGLRDRDRGGGAAGARRPCARPASCSASIPLFLASEGRCVAFVPPRATRSARSPRCAPTRSAAAAARIGRVRAGPPRVVVRTALGGRRLLVLPAGDPLPRIC